MPGRYPLMRYALRCTRSRIQLMRYDTRSSWFPVPLHLLIRKLKGFLPWTSLHILRYRQLLYVFLSVPYYSPLLLMAASRSRLHARSLLAYEYTSCI